MSTLLTEKEKKKKQNVTTLDEWLNSNKSTLETNRQRDLEDNYTQQQLMNKYLAQDMKVSGLNGSGLGELYKQQRNVDYMNNRANINQGYAQQEQDLLNQYYAEKKAKDEEEQQAWYETIYGDGGLASQKISELDDDGDGKLTDEQMKDLQMYLDGYNGKINPNDAERAGIAIDLYRMTDADIRAYEQAQIDAYKKLEQETEQAFREEFKKQNGYYPDDAFVEKAVKGGLNNFKDGWDSVKNWWKKYIAN